MGFGAFVAKPRTAAVLAAHQLRHIGMASRTLTGPIVHSAFIVGPFHYRYVTELYRFQGRYARSRFKAI